jgi:hypothetical protein
MPLQARWLATGFDRDALPRVPISGSNPDRETPRSHQCERPHSFPAFDTDWRICPSRNKVIQAIEVFDIAREMIEEHDIEQHALHPDCARIDRRH